MNTLIISFIIGFILFPIFYANQNNTTANISQFEKVSMSVVCCLAVCLGALIVGTVLFP